MVMWDYKIQWMSGKHHGPGEKPKYSVKLMEHWALKYMKINLHTMKKPIRPI